MFQKLGLVAFVATFGTIAFVQIAQAEPANVRGEIVSFSTDALTVKTREGETLNLALADGWMVSSVATAAITDIKAGDYVGIASLPTSAGGNGALEVLIFPEAMKGAGEGSYGWDLQPESTMTNATVADAVSRQCYHDKRRHPGVAGQHELGDRRLRRLGHCLGPDATGRHDTPLQKHGRKNWSRSGGMPELGFVAHIR
ncbi:hypothetical protein [Cypionkella sp. TWP1-2-1b2]|uniref:hypothetical protein n=1 Tax=Cypionkella sp. TWP1-2-1b2 TaxID=2804675 RepID=UPI003CEF2120